MPVWRGLANEAADYAIDHWADLEHKNPSERRALIAGAHRRRKDKAAKKAGGRVIEWSAGKDVDDPNAFGLTIT